MLMTKVINSNDAIINAENHDISAVNVVKRATRQPSKTTLFVCSTSSTYKSIKYR
jgi:hypothetical protein